MPPVPTRACCCLARPMVKVVMPPASGRPHLVDLWLCGHHYHASRQALAAFREADQARTIAVVP
jgi:hypothetical protein